MENLEKGLASGMTLGGIALAAGSALDFNGAEIAGTSLLFCSHVAYLVVSTARTAGKAARQYIKGYSRIRGDKRWLDELPDY